MSGFSSSYSSYDDDYYSSSTPLSWTKIKRNNYLRDNNVESVKRDSIHRHLMFAVNRFITFIWSTTLSPAFTLIWKCCSYFIHFMWKILHILYPVFAVFQQNIYSLTQFVLNRAYDYIYCPMTTCLQMIWKNIAWLLSSVWSIFSLFVQSIYDDIIVYISQFIIDLVHGICSYLKQVLETAINHIMDGIRLISNSIYHYLLKPFGRLFVNIWMIFLSPMFSSIYQFLVDFMWDPMLMAFNFINDGIKTLWDSICNLIQIIVDYIWRNFINGCLIIYDNILQPLWTNYVKSILCIFQDMFAFIGTSIMKIYDVIYRYLLEMNVAKLAMPTNKQYLNNYEIGVYYARLSKQNSSTLYLNKKSNGNDDYVYLWLRNNAKLKRGNAKIMVYDRANNNALKMYEKIVRLNKKQSHAIPIRKSLFQNKKQKIKIEFILEDISKTEEAESNQRSIVAQNIAFQGEGAKYIVVDQKTKCQHQVFLCYQ